MAEAKVETKTEKVLTLADERLAIAEHLEQQMKDYPNSDLIRSILHRNAKWVKARK